MKWVLVNIKAMQIEKVDVSCAVLHIVQELAAGVDSMTKYAFMATESSMNDLKKDASLDMRDLTETFQLLIQLQIHQAVFAFHPIRWKTIRT